MFADLKGLHDLEEAGKAFENRNSGVTLTEKIQTARRDYIKKGSAKLNEAKSKMEQIIISGVSKGDSSISIDVGLFDLGPSERKSLEAWLVENGVKCRRVSDQRDGDYYHLEIT